jgi:hypothetical protein
MLEKARSDINRIPWLNIGIVQGFRIIARSELMSKARSFRA